MWIVIKQNSDYYNYDNYVFNVFDDKLACSYIKECLVEYLENTQSNREYHIQCYKNKIQKYNEQVKLYKNEYENYKLTHNLEKMAQEARYQESIELDDHSKSKGMWTRHKKCQKTLNKIIGKRKRVESELERENQLLSNVLDEPTPSLMEVFYKTDNLWIYKLNGNFAFDTEVYMSKNDDHEEFFEKFSDYFKE